MTDMELRKIAHKYALAQITDDEMDEMMQTMSNEDVCKLIVIIEKISPKYC